jgi:hypothetical protein
MQDRGAPIRHEMPFAGPQCACGCGGQKFLSKKERIEMLEEYISHSALNLKWVNNFFAIILR